MKILFIFFGLFLANAQTVQKDQQLLIEAGISTDFSPKIKTRNPAVVFGLWWRYPLEKDSRLELGGQLKSSNNYYEFNYGKNGIFYPVDSKVTIVNLGGRMVKEFKVKNQKLDWISELTLSLLFFDGTGIPDDPIREPANENSKTIVIDAEDISTLQFSQGIRIWKGNLGFGLKASFAPYGLWYKTTIPGQFNVFSAEAIVAIKL